MQPFVLFMDYGRITFVAIAAGVFLWIVPNALGVLGTREATRGMHTRCVCMNEEMRHTTARWSRIVLGIGIIVLAIYLAPLVRW